MGKMKDMVISMKDKLGEDFNRPGPIKEKDRKGNIFYKNENGEYHRTDGPAIERSDGSKYWYLNGKRHRTNGPAVEYNNGTKEWWINGERHRTDGPAIEYSDGSKYWYLNGKVHRTDGPAVELSNGTKEWWINGERHRTDGPAVECNNGTNYWYLNGKKHRADGPAVEWDDGTKFWWLNGERHRTDGPAIEWSDGDKSWWINGEHLTKEEFKNHELHKSSLKVKKSNTCEGTKHDKGKPRTDLLPADALLEISKVFSFGAGKYEDRNWEKGINFSRLLGASGRHDLKFKSKIHPDLDDESGLSHIAHKIANDMMLLQFLIEKRNDLDDRGEKYGRS